MQLLIRQVLPQLFGYSLQVVEGDLSLHTQKVRKALAGPPPIPPTHSQLGTLTVSSSSNSLKAFRISSLESRSLYKHETEHTH